VLLIEDGYSIIQPGISRTHGKENRSASIELLRRHSTSDMEFGALAYG